MSRRYVYTRGPAPGVGPQGQAVTWDGLADDYAAYLKRHRRTEKHIYDVRNTIKRFGRGWQAAGVRPCDMNRKILNAALDSYKATGVVDVSVNHAATKIMALYTWAYKEDIFPTDKLANFEKWEIRDRKKHNLVTLEEIGLIKRAITESWSPEHAPASRFRSEEARTFFRVRDICMTLWLPEVGTRVGEMCSVTLDALDLEARSVLLTDTKNGDDRLGFFTTVFGDGPLKDWLTIRCGEEFEALTDKLFVTETGLPINPYTWGRGWNKYVTRAGIARRIRRHDLRHFSSTAHDRVDKDLSKKIIGHHTDAAHAIYSHRELSELRDAHDLANPIGPLLEAAKAEAEILLAASNAQAPRKKVYTKRDL